MVSNSEYQKRTPLIENQRVNQTKAGDSTPLKVISLFSGAGGLDIGFENAGFAIEVAVEADPACCETLRANRPSLPIINARIEDVTVGEILLKGNMKPLEAALVIGGPPCQSFSIAGMRKGLDDNRGKLLFEFVRVVREALPVGFVLENVRGLENWDSGRALETLVSELTKPIEYNGQTYTYSVAEPQVLDAADFGVPQHRERIVIVGNRKKMPFSYPQTSASDRQVTVWSAIGNLPAPDEPSKTAIRVSQTIKGRREKHGY
jgi:DNA (cytosine-5)-methyltransferase 1